MPTENKQIYVTKIKYMYIYKCSIEIENTFEDLCVGGGSPFVTQAGLELAVLLSQPYTWPYSFNTNQIFYRYEQGTPLQFFSLRKRISKV